MVVVTGGSEGIGYALARRFAAAGNDLMLVARRPRAAQGRSRAHPRRVQGRGRCRPRRRHRARCHPRHRGGAGGAPGLCRRARQQCRHGTCRPVPRPGAGDGCAAPRPQRARADPLTRHFLPGMRVRGRGGILNLASLGGYAPGPNQAVYYASKAYVLSFSEAIAAETAGRGRAHHARWRRARSTPAFTRAWAPSGRFYRYLVAPASAGERGRGPATTRFALGLRVIVPGLVNPLLALVMRILPHRIVIPIVGVLLKPRGAGPQRCSRLDLPIAPRRAPPATCRAAQAAPRRQEARLHRAAPGELQSGPRRPMVPPQRLQARHPQAALRRCRCPRRWRTTAAPSSSAGR